MCSNSISNGWHYDHDYDCEVLIKPYKVCPLIDFIHFIPMLITYYSDLFNGVPGFPGKIIEFEKVMEKSLGIFKLDIGKK